MNSNKNKSNIFWVIAFNLLAAIVLAVVCSKIFSSMNKVFFIVFGIIVILSNFMVNTRYISTIIATVPVGYAVAILATHIFNSVQNNNILSIAISTLSNFGNYFLPMVITTACSGVIMLIKTLTAIKNSRNVEE